MKTKLFSILTLLLCVCSGAWATDIVWTFTASDLKNNATFAGKGTNTFIADDGTTELVYKGNSDSDALVSKDVTIGGTSYTTYLNLNGATGSSRYMYISGISGSGTLTIVFASGKTNSAAITVNDNAYNGTAIATLAAPSNGNFNGTAQAIEITSTLDDRHSYYINGHRSIYSVIWSPDDKIVPIATFSTSSFVLTPEDYTSFAVPTLTIQNGSGTDISSNYTVTYVSDNSTLAEVTNASTGAVTIHPLSEGTETATITATLTPNDADAYASKSVSYTITYKAGLATQISKFWKFSDSTWSSFPTSSGSAITENTTVDNMEILAVSGNTAYIQSSDATFSDGKLSKYIQFGLVAEGARQFHIKVAGKSVISVYAKAGGSNRKVKVTKDSKDGEAIGEQDASSSPTIHTFNYTGTEAADLYIFNSGGSSLNFYGIKVEHLSSGPVITTQPVGATYDLNATATALTIEAEPYTEGKALSYQWYSNTTNSTEGATAISGATSTSYTPSTTTGGTTYYYCVVTEADNEETTTSEIVAVKVVDLGELIVTLQPGTSPGKDTTIPSFSKNGFTTSGLTTISYYEGFPYNFKASGTITITAPSNATINSLKIYGFRNSDSNTTTVTAGTGSSISGSATLGNRNTTGDLSEVLLVVDAPAAGNTVSFNIGAQSRIMIKVYGSATYADQTVTATKEYSTFCSAYDLDFSGVSNLEAYTVTAINTSSATITKVNAAPAGTGLILKKTANVGTETEFAIPVIASADAVGTNYLVGVTVDTNMSSVSNAYILSDGLFYACTEGTLAAGKAYLVAEAWATSPARSFALVMDGETTEINNVENSWLKVDGYYNLNGQRVAQPTKGLYIVNGKKVVIK